MENNKESYVEFIRTQKVRVPLKTALGKQEFINFVNADENMFDYDGQIFDFDNEEVVDEDYSYANNDCKLVIEGNVKYEFKSPYKYSVLKIK